MEVSSSKVLDVSWKFGVTAASSEMSKVGRTYLQVRLLLDESSGGGERNSVFAEMSLTQFCKLLHDLETAKNNIDLLQ
ncbi:COMM domain-containing protein 7 [Cephus cinctus]|uniref:COMM domain-containing protein 7 n=1 Tax=Cephus cinctus TaxID=211228 RepID=A0AAJ7CBJ3_CEPCN|nr:COMM domain-containing protein 7 [Cephus cinctus]